MQVIPLLNIEFNRLRAVFPMQVRPPFGYTDFLGEYASSGFPQYAVSGPDGNGGVSGQSFNAVFSANDGSQTNNSTGGVEFDSVSRCVYPRTIFVMHDNIFGGATYGGGTLGAPGASGPNGNPSVIWSGFACTNAYGGVVEVNQTPPGFTKIVATAVDGTATASFSMAAVPGAATGCQGFTAVLLPYAAKITRSQSPYLSLRWRVAGASRNSIRWYAMSLHIGGNTSIGYNDVTDGGGNPVPGNWIWSDNLKSGAGRAALMAPANNGQMPNVTTVPPTSLPPPNDPQIFEVRLVGGQMRMLLGAEDSPYQWPHPQIDSSGIPDWFIDRWQIYGNDLVGAEWSVHLTKFFAGAATVSQDINTGVHLDPSQIANTQLRVHYAPTNTYAADGSVATASAGLTFDASQVGFHPPNHTATASVFDVLDTLIRYRLAWSGPVTGVARGISYCDYTSPVRAVSLDIPGDQYQIFNPPTILGNPAYGYLPLPQKVDVFNEFDIGSLTVNSRAEMTWNNFQGTWTNGFGTGFLDNQGHFAVGIAAGIAGFAAGMRQEFTGIGNTSFSNSWGGQGRDTVTMMCRDCWAMLDVPCVNLPWFDGWNVYYVIAYLASLGTITSLQMGFANFIPSQPYGASPGLPPSANYYMPVGAAGGPVTRFGLGMKLRDVMMKISNSIGYTLFFDVGGVLQFYPFQTPFLTLAYGIKTFQEVAGAPGGLTPGLNEIWSGSYSSSLEEVRNNVAVIGVNVLGPIWDAKVAHQYDNDSIYNDSVANYVGWPSPLVWADNIFSVPGFADAAAKSMLNYLRIPDKPVNFSTWYQGDAPVYPGDIIQVQYTRSGASGYLFFVTGTHVCFENGQAARLDIQARLVPPEVITP